MTDGDRYRRAAGVNVAGNLAKCLIEGVLGLVFGSTALLADAADSVMDLFTSGLALVLGSRAYASEDDDHPHGHGRYEPLAAFLVGLVMVVAGVRIGIAAFHGLFDSIVPGSPLLLLAGAVAAITIKLGLYLFNREASERLSSTSLHAMAVDARNDIVKSAAAAVGVAGVFAGLLRLEAVAGIGISVIVIYDGLRVMQENTGYLVGAAPPGTRIEAVRETMLDDDAVEGVHDLVVHYLGASCEVETHVEVDGDMSLREAHDVETRLVMQLRDLERVTDAHIHLDPSGIGEWKSDNDNEG